MTPDIRYRLFFDDEPASQEDLDRVEEITVEQEVDMAWEAHLQIPVCTDAQGQWTGDDLRFMSAYARIRVEIKVGDGGFVPLIDGPVVGSDRQRRAEPGQSTVTLVVHDDSAFLNREESLERFENRADHEVAEQIYQDASPIVSTDVEPTAPPPSDVPPVVVQRGTRMRLLRMLAQRQGMHAYVLPGEVPGQSVGCFKAFPTAPSGLPPLTLLGAGRTIDTFDVQQNAQRAATAQAARLSLTDRGLTEAASQFSDLDLLGPGFTFENDQNTATQLPTPGPGGQVAPDRRAAAATEASSYEIEASGSIRPCYTGVLRPYEVVTVRGAGPRLSGDYLVFAVTHTLTRSEYAQSFTFKRNALSEGTDPGVSSALASIF